MILMRYGCRLTQFFIREYMHAHGFFVRLLKKMAWPHLRHCKDCRTYYERVFIAYQLLGRAENIHLKNLYHFVDKPYAVGANLNPKHAWVAVSWFKMSITMGLLLLVLNTFRPFFHDGPKSPIKNPDSLDVLALRGTAVLKGQEIRIQFYCTEDPHPQQINDFQSLFSKTEHEYFCPSVHSTLFIAYENRSDKAAYLVGYVWNYKTQQFDFLIHEQVQAKADKIALPVKITQLQEYQGMLVLKWLKITQTQDLDAWQQLPTAVHADLFYTFLKEHPDIQYWHDVIPIFLNQKKE